MTITIVIPAIKVAVTNPPMNKPPPAAAVSTRAGAPQSVHALITVTATFCSPADLPVIVMEKGTCPMILSAIVEAVSEPSSLEYCMVAE